MDEEITASRRLERFVVLLRYIPARDVVRVDLAVGICGNRLLDLVRYCLASLVNFRTGTSLSTKFGWIERLGFLFQGGVRGAEFLTEVVRVSAGLLCG